MPADLLPCVEVGPDGAATGAVIWLHGLGADGHDFEPIVPLLGLDPALGVRFVFPHAPRRAVTINTGLIMPAWYDIRSLTLRRDIDETGVRESAEQVRRLIQRENERSEANRATPIFQAHGTADPMVPLTLGERTRDRLRQLGHAVEWHTYPVGHEVHPEEVRQVGRVLGRRLVSAR